MAGDSWFSSNNSSRLRWKLAGILALLAMTAVGIIPLTLAIIYGRQSDALAIDMAGRQRMLLERHMKEVLLASQGTATRYDITREVLRNHLAVLQRGGQVPSSILRDETVSLPGAPTETIRQQFETQRHLLDSFIMKADLFIRVPQASPMRSAALAELLADNTRLLETANDAVQLWARESESNVSRLIHWEITFVGLVVLAGAFLAWRLNQSEKELRRSQEVTLDALRQSDAVKSSLLSSVSHELRTPLTAIKTMLFELQCGASDSATDGQVRKDSLENIHQELDYLNRLVSNLLDMSRIEAGTLAHNRDWHLLDELVEGAVRRVGAELESRPLQIHLAPNLPPVYVDAVELQLVLTNLLENAVKYSPPGSGIVLKASIAKETVEIRVENEGEALVPDEARRIFERFYRTSEAKIRSIRGTGLGLAICKAIVEAHGGSIAAHSQSGQPITILIRLPLSASTQRTLPMASTLAGDHRGSL
ncbi:MAG: ATP-binding protein [Nitrospiraceae bacterium]